MVLPLFPQFTLYELRDYLCRFNPSGLPIEVYMPTTREWSIVVNPEWPITMITGMKQVLLSLRPDYAHQFKDKPRLEELLGRQPRKGPLSKRAAADDLVSPRKPKVPRPMFSAEAIPMATLHDDHETLKLPISKNLPQSSPSPSSLPLSSPPPSSPLQSLLPQNLLLQSSPPRQVLPTIVHTAQNSTPTKGQWNKALRFPAEFPAHDILEKTSQYISKRNGRHGKFREVFQQIFGRNCSKTTEANLPKLYPKAYTHFLTLDQSTQATITWNELVKSCDNAAPSFPPPNVVHFINPVQLHTPTPPLPPPAVTKDLMSSDNPVLPSSPIPPKTPPLLPAASQPTLDPPQVQAAFPLNIEMQPLGPEELAVLDADVALVRTTRAFLGDGISAGPDLEDELFGQESAGLQCPFCNTKLPGRQYSDALLTMLNSPTIQTHTVPDPTLSNPNHRRSLIGHFAYSDFCAQHVLEELTLVANSHQWPYPPDFSTLAQRVKEKEGYLNAVIMEIMTGVEVSKFYSDLLTMNSRQQYDQSLNIISAG